LNQQPEIGFADLSAIANAPILRSAAEPFGSSEKNPKKTMQTGLQIIANVFIDAGP